MRGRYLYELSDPYSTTWSPRFVFPFSRRDCFEMVAKTISQILSVPFLSVLADRGQGFSRFEELTRWENVKLLHMGTAVDRINKYNINQIV
jgi:hypothetical protein